MLTVLHSLGDLFPGVDRRVGILEATLHGQTKHKAASALESDHQSMMFQQIESLKAQLAKKTTKTKLFKERYKYMIGMYQSQLDSPTTTP